jgi:hypothetical protein
MSLLNVRRVEDDNMTLWSVFNRVQENAMKGGYASQDRAGRNVTTAGITSVNRDINFNHGHLDVRQQVLDIVAA